MAQYPKRVQQAYQEALKVRMKAYAPYSHFKVGAAVVFQGSDLIHTGCNIENASFGATVCAERIALYKGLTEEVSAPLVDFVVLVTQEKELTMPCALCLQVMSEFCETRTPVYIGNLTGLKKKLLFKELLPKAFRKFKKDT